MKYPPVSPIFLIFIITSFSQQAARCYQTSSRYIMLRFIHVHYAFRGTDCGTQKNYNRHLGIDCKRTLYEIRKIKPDYETMTIFLQSVKIPSDLANYSQRNMDFCKASHGSPFSKFCHLNVHECMWLPQADCVHKRQAHKHISNFMHTFLTKVVPDNLKPCQICKIM